VPEESRNAEQMDVVLRNEKQALVQYLPMKEEHWQIQKKLAEYASRCVEIAKYLE
jgi:hypothetical protein